MKYRLMLEAVIKIRRFDEKYSRTDADMAGIPKKNIKNRSKKIKNWTMREQRRNN